MLIERVIREFGYDTPIFAEEILELFNGLMVSGQRGKTVARFLLIAVIF